MPNYLSKVVYLTDTQYASLLANPNTAINGHKYDPNALYITNTAGNANTVNGHTVNADVPYGALFTDQYHTTGTWDGMTYTATSVNGAGALTFTLPASSSNIGANLIERASDGSFISGSMLAQNTSNNTAGLYIAIESYSYKFGWHMGTGGTNHGLYDWHKNGIGTAGWILLADANNDWIFNGNAATSTSAQRLAYSSQVTTLEGINTFGTTNAGFLKVAKVSAIDGKSGTWGKNDGILMNLPWSSTYGHQVYFDDNSLQIHHRANNNGTWTDWAQILSNTDIMAGDGNGQIKIAGTNISITGLKALAYKDSLTASDVDAAPSSTVSCTTANVKTALGTGSGTTKFLREDGTWQTPAYIANTDEKVKVTALTSGTTYYPILATTTDTATRQADTTLKGLSYISTAGTTSAVGTAILALGNNTAKGTANNEQGVLRLYGTTAYYVDIKMEDGLPAANRTMYLPSYAGTMYMVAATTTNAVGSTTKPIYIDNTGTIQEGTALKNLAYIDKPSSNTTTTWLRGDGTWVAPPNDNTASAVDDILDGSNSGTAITYKPYTSQQSKLSFDTSSTAPSRTDRLNLNGYLYATKLYSGGTEVSVSGHTHSYLSSISWSGDTNLKLKQSVNGATATDVLQFVAGSNITLTGASGKLTIAGTANDAVTHTVKTTTKYYVTGTETATTSTGGDTFDTGIYATTVAGQLNATSYKVNENVTLQYNSTDLALEFVFA